MNSFKNPETPLILNPVNIDRYIQDIQIALSALTWLEKCFARAYNSKRSDPYGKISVYPEVWQGAGKDLLNVLPNDNIKSQCFFKVEEPITCLEFNPVGYSLMQATVSIIFWFNLNEINKTADHRFIELLKAQAQRIITDNVEGLKIFDTPEQVFKGYDISKMPSDNLIHPFGGFRFETEIPYVEDCPEAVI